MCFFFYFSEADDVKLLLHSPEKGDIGDEGGGDPSVVLLPLEHAVNGDSLGPSAVAAPLPVNNNPPDDDDDNG